MSSLILEMEVTLLLKYPAEDQYWVVGPSRPDPGLPTPKRWKRLVQRAPQELGVKSASMSALFFAWVG